MTAPRVWLHPLDEQVLEALLDIAVGDADPAEVMPTVEGPPGWNVNRRRAFLEFHRERALRSTGDQTMYAVVVDGTVAGMVRLGSRDDESRELGIWLGRRFRGHGVGTAALRQLLAAARQLGVQRVVATTTANNVAAQQVLSRLGARLQHGGTGIVEAVVDLDTPATSGRDAPPR